MAIRSGLKWGKGCESSRRVPPRPVIDRAAVQPEKRELVPLTQTQLAVLTGGVAALIEESFFDVGATDLREFVRLHSKLYRLMGWPPDYAWRDGAVVAAADRSTVIKRPGLARLNDEAQAH